MKRSSMERLGQNFGDTPFTEVEKKQDSGKLDK